MNNNTVILSKFEKIRLHALIDFWCGDETEPCKRAIMSEVIKACENGEIACEGRTNPWHETIQKSLIAGELLIVRESFDKWAARFLEANESSISKINFKAEQTLLKIIGALITIHYDKLPFKVAETGRYKASAIEADILKKLPQDNGLKEGTIRKKIPAALDAIKENLYAGTEEK